MSTIPGKKGFQPKRNPKTAIASQDIISAFSQAPLSGQLEPQTIIREPPMRRAEKPSGKILLTSLESKPIRPRIIREVKATPDIIPIKREIGPKVQQAINRLSPDFKKYQDEQRKIEETNPYLTDTTIYTPQTRKSFYRFISDNYRETFALPAQLTTKIDEDACAKLGEAAKEKVESFLYQKFVREYIRQANPYRGMLVYHGLGSGKTCSSIAAAEALYGTANKKVIVMTPFSLRANFMSEISFCGFRHFSLKNYWIPQPVTNNIVKAFAKSVLSLSDIYLQKLEKREDESRRVLWIADFDKKSNYDELTPQQRDDIRAQLNETIENRITFINYNGIQASKLKEYACIEDPITGKRFFDDAVIVIDEIHNLTRLMQGTIVPYMISRPGKKRKIPAEPVIPGKWKPQLCRTSSNYKRAFLFYKLLTDARNSKIIGLSGTPIINFPEELGILTNVLSGYIECVEMSILTTDSRQVDRFMEIVNAELRIDIVRKTEARGMYNILISVFQEGYEKVFDVDNNNNFIGVKYNPEAQDTIQTVYARIKEKAKAEKIPISASESYVSYPRLPPDEDTFRGNFINADTLAIKNEVVLKKRLTGLISYYKGSKEEYMPRVTRDEIVKCEMSDYTLQKYTVERNMEIKGEIKKKSGDGGDVFADVEMFAKMKNPSSYRFRSRALCNFAFPKGIERPFPNTTEEEEEETTQLEDLGVAEAMTNPDEDLKAQMQVDMEEETIADPEEDIIEQVGGENTNDEEEIELTSEEEEEMLRKLIEGDSNTNSNTNEEEEEDEEEDEDNSNFIVEPIKPEAVKVVSVTKGEQSKPLRKRPEVKALPEKKAEEKTILNTLSEGVEAVIDAPQELIMGRRLTYQERIKNAMIKLDNNKEKYLLLDSPIQEARLAQYSSKLDNMLRRIVTSKGSNLVYSQFKTVEGLGVLGISLKANGFTEIEIEGSDLDPRFSDKTIESLRKGPKLGEKRFISFTGEGSRERRALVLNVFNGNFDKLPTSMQEIMIESGYGENRNKYGEICWVIGITGAGAEGISLKCCRSVHIMEPYWNNVRLDQVKGRAIRICSHQDLPYRDREVEIYTYYTVFSREQINSDKIDMTIRTTDENETSDEKVFNVSVRKDKINQEILTIMKEAAVDCQLNAPDNGEISCFEVDGKIDQYMFDPDLQTDIINTSIELTEDKRKIDDIKEPIKSVGEETKIPDRRATTFQVPVIEWEGKQYMISEKPGSGGLIMHLFEMTDLRLRRPVGDISKDPISDDFDEPVLY